MRRQIQGFQKQLRKLSHGMFPRIALAFILVTAVASIARGSFYYNLAMWWGDRAPKVPVITVPNAEIWSDINTQEVTGTCDSPGTVSVNIYIGGALETNTTCTLASTFTTQVIRTADGAYAITAKAVNAGGIESDPTASVTWNRDTVPPHLSVFQLNGSCSSTIATNMVPADVQIDNKANSLIGKVRFSLNPVFSDSGWQNYSNPTTYVAPFVAGSSVLRVVYVWAKDKAGNISSNSLTCQATTNIGMPPNVKFINPTGGVANTTGQIVHVDWNISSVPGLAASNAIEIDYTTDDGATYTMLDNTLSDGANSGCAIGVGATGCFEFALPAALNGTHYKLILRATDVNGAVGMVLSGILNVSGLRLYAGNDASLLGSAAMSTTADFSSYSAAQAIDSQGNIYALGNNCTVYKIDGLTGNITLIMGKGACVYGADIVGQTPSATLTSGISAIYTLVIDSQDNIYFDDYYLHRIIRLNKTTGLFENWAGGDVSLPYGGTNWSPPTGTNKFNAAIQVVSMAIDSQDRLLFVNVGYGSPAVPGGLSYYEDYGYQSPYVLLRVNADSTLEVLVGDHTLTSGPVDGDLGTAHGLTHSWDGDVDPVLTTTLGNPAPINYHGYGWGPVISVKRGSPDIVYMWAQGSDPVHSYDYGMSVWAYDTGTKRMSYVYDLGTNYPYSMAWDESRSKLILNTSYYGGPAAAFKIIDTAVIDDPAPVTIDVSALVSDAVAGFGLDTSGGIYFVANNHQQLFYVDPSTNIVYSYAGATPNSGNGGDAKLATFRFAWEPVKDSAGNIYFHDEQNLETRKIDSSGIISLVRPQSDYFGHTHFAINPANDHLTWHDAFASIAGVDSVPLGNIYGAIGGVFDLMTNTCIFLCGDPDTNWWAAGVPPPGNRAIHIADGANGYSDIWAGYNYQYPWGIAFDPVSGDFYFHHYDLYTHFTSWGPPEDYGFTDLIGRITNTNAYYKVVASVDMAGSGTTNYATLPVVGNATAGNNPAYYSPSSQYDYPQTYGGPGHQLQAYNSVVYSMAYTDGNVYAYDTSPGGLVSRVSDQTAGDIVTWNPGYVHSYYIDGPNSAMYYTQDKGIFVKPLAGGDGTSTLMETLPYRFFIGDRTPNANSLLLIHQHQLYEYTNSTYIN